MRPSHLFRADVTELVVVRLGDPADHLVIEAWHSGRGVSRRTRRYGHLLRLAAKPSGIR